MSAFSPFKGVTIPFKVLAMQERFNSAKKLDSVSTLSFYPNYFVTPKIFRVLKENFLYSRKQMLIGKPGISKSMGFLLSSYLSSVSTEYRFLDFTDSQKLISKGLLNQYGVKIIYCSFKITGMSYRQFFELL